MPTTACCSHWIMIRQAFRVMPNSWREYSYCEHSKANGYKVYTANHRLEFSERVWLDVYSAHV